jgi:sec-independent protein translocase protein TatC
MGIKWLISQNPPEAKFMPSVQGTLLFILKMYLAFGLVFQMPVVLMFLGKAGLISSVTLRSYWRQAVVAIGILAAAITPSGDAFTMMMMCVPMIILYVLSIGLVRIVEKQP